MAKKRIPLGKEKSEILETLKQAGISYDVSVEVMSYFIENRRRREEIIKWREQADIKKALLRAMGFEFSLINSYFFKQLEKTSAKIIQQIFFDKFGIETIEMRIYHCDEEEYDTEGIIYIAQNPELFPDLIKYIKIRDNTDAMKKLIKEKRTEMIMGKTGE